MHGVIDKKFITNGVVKMIKLLAFDLDGTTLLEHRYIPDENLQALYKASEKGIILVPATGRLRSFLPEDVKKLPFVEYIISANGAVVYDLKENKEIYSSTLDSKKTLECLKVVEKYSLYYEFYCGKKPHTLRSNTENVMEKFSLPESKRYFASKDYIYFDDLEEFLKNEGREIHKINLIHTPLEVRAQIIEDFQKIKGISISSSWFDNLEINHENATKGKALEALCNYLNIKSSETMSIGDNGNDIAMLKWAGTSVAMGNASDEAKNSAKYITDECNNFGFAKAVEKYALK